MKLRPVPPKISLATTTPKLMPRATCHSGIAGGSERGKIRLLTSRPSLTSSLRTMPNNTSQKPPAATLTK